VVEVLHELAVDPRPASAHVLRNPLVGESGGSQAVAPPVSVPPSGYHQVMRRLGLQVRAATQRRRAHGHWGRLVVGHTVKRPGRTGFQTLNRNESGRPGDQRVRHCTGVELRERALQFVVVYRRW
jgi:hypothetical protein